MSECFTALSEHAFPQSALTAGLLVVFSALPARARNRRRARDSAVPTGRESERKAS